MFKSLAARNLEIDAFEGRRLSRIRERDAAQLQAQLRVLQAAGQSGIGASGHAVRMDALHLIRAAAESGAVVDVTLQAQIMELLAGVARAHRIPVLINMHDVELAKRFADRVMPVLQDRPCR